MDKYIELVERDIANRNKIIPVSQLDTKTYSYERYISHYRFDKELVKFVEKTESTADFNGSVTIDNIWVDFDKEDDIEGARKETVKFIKNLSEISGLSPDSFPVFFSGKKGFHVGTSSKMIGVNDVFSVDLPGRIKLFIKAITEGIECIDYSIYNKNRIIRLPFSLHKKSGLYKIMIPFKVLWGKPIATILKDAKECKRYDIKIPKAELNPSLVDIFTSISKKEAVSIVTSKSATSLFAIGENGSRNNTIFKQACRLFDQRDLKTNEVFDIMNTIYEVTKNQSGKEFSKREFDATMNSAFKSTKGNKLDGITIKPVDSLTYEIVDAIRNSRYISTTVPDWDDDMDGGFARGNLYSFIGKGGTKKSMLAMWIGLRAAINDDIPVAYFNMEMSTTQSFIRAFKMLFNRDLKEEIQNGTLKEDELSDMNEEFKKVVKNKFYLIDNNNLNVSDMANVLDQIGESYDNKVGLVIADSMNAMGTVNDNEGATAFKISKELKQLAKDKDVATILINHVTKGVSGHTRDVSPYVRGGEKIRDNCDAYFCLSQCVDKERSVLIGEDKDFVYLKEYMFTRFVNKRDSGNTIDKVLKLGEDLVPRVVPEEPRSFETF